MVDEVRKKNREALRNPRPGDYWHEMYLPYCLVVDVDESAGTITVLSCLGGTRGFENETNAKIDFPGQPGWEFDLEKHIVVDKTWLQRAVLYEKINGFAADVTRTEKTIRIAQEWKKKQNTKVATFG